MAFLRLAVQACKSEDAGMNLVFLAYPDFCVLTGGEEKQDSVRVVIEDSYVFFVRISMGVQRGTMRLDHEQRSTMHASVHDHVTVRVWDGPQIPIRRIQMTVDLPSSPGKAATVIDADELVTTIRRCFADNLLQPRQYLLAVAGGAQLRLRIVGIETPRADFSIALGMAMHARLGAASGMRCLKSAHMRRIAALAFGGGASAGQNFILTRASVIDCQAQPNSPVNLRKQVRGMFLDRKVQQSGSSRAFLRNRAPSPAASILSKHSEGMGESSDEPADEKRFLELSLSQDENGQIVVNDTIGFGDSDQQLLPGDIVESINGQGVQKSGVRKVEEMTRRLSGTFVTFGVVRGGHRSFVTLESDQFKPSQHHRPEALFRDHVSNGPQGRNASASARFDADSDRFSVSPVFSASSTDKYSPSVGRGSQTPPEPWMGSISSSSLRGTMLQGLENGVGSRSDAVEGLAKENERLRAALSTQQKLAVDQAQKLLQERGRVELAEHLAVGLKSQLQLVQRQLQDLRENFCVQSSREEQIQQQLYETEHEVLHLRNELDRSAEQPLSQGNSVEARDSIVRLEEMVETLLNLGEQEAGAIRQDLKVQNQDLRFILAQLQRAELAQVGPSPRVLVPGASTSSHRAPVVFHSSLNGFHRGDLKNSGSIKPLPSAAPEKGLTSLSRSLHHICYSSGEAQEHSNTASRGGLYVSLSEATASLRSASPDLEPLTAHMSPFVVKAEPRTWEETISLLGSSRHDKRPTVCSIHREPGHSRQSLPLSFTPGQVPEDAPRQARMSASHLTWEDAMAGYSRLTTNNLSVSTPEKYHNASASLNSTFEDSSRQEGRRRSSLMRSGPTWRAKGDSIVGNFLTSDEMNKNMHSNKFVPAVFGGEHWEEEQTPCVWAARQAGIHENAVAAVHKLLLKGKPYGQVVKNHRIVHFDLDTKMIDDYIRYCIEFSATSFGRRPHWVLQYLQSKTTHVSSSSPRPSRQAPPDPKTHSKALTHQRAVTCQHAPGTSLSPRDSRYEMPSSPSTVDGYIGLQLGNDKHVIAVRDLMDRNNRLQGEAGYTNPPVQPGDALTHISGASVTGLSLDEIHRLLLGPRGSLVDLTFASTSQVFLVSVVRHAPHEFERSPPDPPEQASGTCP